MKKLVINDKGINFFFIKDKTFYDLYDMPTYEELLIKQKEFITYLERRIEYVTATYQCHRLDVDGMVLFNLKNVLEKYKEIVGVDKE